MNNCKHKKTTVCSSDVAYYIACVDCEKQWDESEWTDEMQEAIDEFAKEAEATGN